MKSIHSKKVLAAAVTAARAAGQLMRTNLRAPKRINEATPHDIKLELDVRCQKLIERTLRRAFPEIPILGEEGILGDPEAPWRWVVDPIDGTVNFYYGIPHACVSIALQARGDVAGSGIRPARSAVRQPFHSMVGVVYDPFCDELWTGVRGKPAFLNGRRIRVSARRTLAESIVALGFAKERATMEKVLPTFDGLIHRVRKIRIMGSAALSLVYVATGRMDAYVEYGLRLWDIAAGGLLIECAGGEFWHQPVTGDYAYQIVASNGLVRREMERVKRKT